MIEVFKTNVKYLDHARLLIAEIKKLHSDYEANFDLDDCDSILRVKCTSQVIHATQLIELLSSYGFEASVLPDEVPTLDESASPQGAWL
jgi:hypothetical protein